MRIVQAKNPEHDSSSERLIAGASSSAPAIEDNRRQSVHVTQLQTIAQSSPKTSSVIQLKGANIQNLPAEEFASPYTPGFLRSLSGQLYDAVESYNSLADDDRDFDHQIAILNQILELCIQVQAAEQPEQSGTGNPQIQNLIIIYSQLHLSVEDIKQGAFAAKQTVVNQRGMIPAADPKLNFGPKSFTHTAV